MKDLENGGLKLLNGGEVEVGHVNLQWMRVMGWHMGTNGFDEYIHDFSQISKIGRSKFSTILNITQLAWDRGEWYLGKIQD